MRHGWRLVVVVWLLSVTSAVAQEGPSGAIQIPRGLIDTQLPGCRDTAWLGEGQFSRELYPFLVLWNPLPVEQRVEAQIVDASGVSPVISNLPPLKPWERRAFDWFALKRQYSHRFSAYAVSIRWEYGGSAHLVTWRVPDIFTTPFYDWAAWMREWRVELVSPVRYVTVCIG